ncbi:ABC transporter permease subunit [Nocardia cyriacigeorgica]|uniref:ABC transporter permease n=1 Tax=Nocardia cyriacigeorgica TaxID=135487 RepID=UPI0018934691|nr:ABC transporter permease subunit [Nocardia cyriacigeorgica]MBF6158645.1 ABC transporter permease subunit [Nocardia cyriacigeorgica]MBF6197667.1 ABC transporter permease subunit [Nocardia cyriacigeorgica]MBF6316533.1 ABC transporter permease subunit [Nocardia cyriacigeorgica]MBF6517273.1 ABC transporter permease subunit [Nocardia cyriacigeorgica]MBF6534850.1 ABC transporter permease subunit [Nocardia cyriacigeorgica]
MLVWTGRGRALVLAVFAVVVLVVFAAPIATVFAAALAGSWTGPLPSDLGTANLERALSGEQVASLSVSVQTALLAGAVSLVLGTWAALAARVAPQWWRRLTDAVFHLPVAVPSVAIGLGVLIAFNERPLLLGGTKWIVIMAHSVLVLAYAFSAVSAALDRLDPGYRQAAESLGAGPVRVLCQVTLPLLLPALGAAAGLAVALSMGELGATIMVYPATWKTLPVSIFALTDRGEVFDAAAGTTVLVLVTLLAVILLGRIKGRAALR